MIKKDIIIETMMDADVSDLIFPIVTIYNSPVDYDGKIVARIFEGAKAAPTNVICIYGDIESARDDIKAAGYTTVIPRSENDYISIVESHII